MPHLTEDQKQFYNTNGFIKLINIFTEAEMDEMSSEYNLIFTTKDNEGMEAAWAGESMRKQANYINYSVKSVHNLQMHSSVFSRAVMNSKLLDACEDIMKTKNILLHHTKAHLKPPENGAPYLMHQDYHYFPFEKDSMVAVFIHLDDTTPENGGLAVYPGSHKLGPQEDKGVLERGETYHYLDQGLYEIGERFLSRHAIYSVWERELSLLCFLVTLDVYSPTSHESPTWAIDYTNNEHHSVTKH